MAEKTHQRRDDILEAALTCFLAKGYAATSIADIRQSSGASTGSIYHFFAGKSAIAMALLEQAVAGWAAAGSAATDPKSDAETSIRASVSGLLSWGLENPRLLRFLDEIRTLSATDKDFAPLRHALDQGLINSAARYAEFVAAGAVRALPYPVAHAVMLGAAYDYLRLIGLGQPTGKADIALIVDAAWNAVRA